MQALSRVEPRRGPALALALGALLLAALVVSTSSAGAAAPAETPQSCPGFSVLHNDRIGPAVFPAGTYTLTIEDQNLECKAGGELFSRFLEDFDGVLPKPWTVEPEASGRSTFTRGALPGFAVELTGKAGESGGPNADLGRLCPDPFTVNSTAVIGPLRFIKGKFLVYLPRASGVSCNRAAVLFTRFLGSRGTLPPPWRLIGQTATFYKPANATRSAFRVEPLQGSGRR